MPDNTSLGLLLDPPPPHPLPLLTKCGKSPASCWPKAWETPILKEHINMKEVPHSLTNSGISDLIYPPQCLRGFLAAGLIHQNTRGIWSFGRVGH